MASGARGSTPTLWPGGGTVTTTDPVAEVKCFLQFCLILTSSLFRLQQTLLPIKQRRQQASLGRLHLGQAPGTPGLPLQVPARLRIAVISVTRGLLDSPEARTSGDNPRATRHLLGPEGKEVDSFHQGESSLVVKSENTGYVLAWRVVLRLRHHDELPQQVPGGQHGGDPEPQPGPGTQGAAGVQPGLLSTCVYCQ